MNLEGKNVFLSGGMSGYEHYNVEAFANAHAIVHELGAKCVYDPAFAWLHEPLADGEKKTHEDYMLKCLHELTRPKYCGKEGAFYDLLVSLPHWGKSKGAMAERAAAEACGIPCVELDELYLAQVENEYERR
jgi:hypothetical protein